jgi:hypothetical protein
METTHGKTHSENGEGECWWSPLFLIFIHPAHYSIVPFSLRSSTVGVVADQYMRLCMVQRAKQRPGLSIRCNFITW